MILSLLVKVRIRDSPPYSESVLTRCKPTVNWYLETILSADVFVYIRASVLQATNMNEAAKLNKCYSFHPIYVYSFQGLYTRSKAVFKHHPTKDLRL